LSTSATLMSA